MDFGQLHPAVWFAAGAAVLAALGAIITYAIMHEIAGSPF
jgi:hypothetical protein